MFANTTIGKKLGKLFELVFVSKLHCQLQYQN
jgi:hypothetical protein